MKPYFKEHKEQVCNKGIFSDLQFNKRWCENANKINFGTESMSIQISTQ